MTERKCSVLVADRNGVSNWTLEKELTEAGFSVETATSTSRSLWMLETREFAALIVDVLMPECMDTHLIVWARQNLPNMPIVALSETESSLLRHISYARGADLFLTKPVDIEKLMAFLSPPSDSKSFSGTIDGTDMLEYLQFLMLSRKKTVLEIVSRTGSHGRIYLSDGEVVHAFCGAMSGERALYRCLSFEGGSFSHRPWSEPAEVTIRRPGELLLFEAARMRDDGRDQNFHAAG